MSMVSKNSFSTREIDLLVQVLSDVLGSGLNLFLTFQSAVDDTRSSGMALVVVIACFLPVCHY